MNLTHSCSELWTQLALCQCGYHTIPLFWEISNPNNSLVTAVPCTHCFWFHYCVSLSSPEVTIHLQVPTTHASHAVSQGSGTKHRLPPPLLCCGLLFFYLSMGFNSWCRSFLKSGHPLPSSFTSTHCSIPMSEHQILERFFLCCSPFHFPTV